MLSPLVPPYATEKVRTYGGLLLTLWVLLGTVVLASGCGTRGVDPAYEVLVEQQSDLPDTGGLGPGDKFELRVHNQPELTGEFTVSSEGDINYPYIGRIKVLNRTCADLEIQISEGLADGYLANPSVRCAITEFNSKRLFIFGEVKNPGSYPYKSNVTIIEGIAIAGGFAGRADKNGTKLSRVVNNSEIRVTVPVQDIVEGKSRNLRLLPGDILFVPDLPF